MEARIADIEVTLKRAKLIDESDISNDSVHIGSTVTVYNDAFGEDVTYNIVSASEADPENNKISDESPVGKSLLGKKLGDKVTVELPNGSQIFLDVKEIHR